jgi:DNA primase
MQIPKQFLDEVRYRLRLSDIIGKRIKVTRTGREYKACCPFHREKTPSFTINDEKGFFHCFGCGAHGDHIGFMMRHDNMQFMDAVEMLASEAGLQVPQPSPKDVEKAKKKKALKNIVEDACRFFEDHLYASENAEVMRYLMQERGLSAETIAAFRLGYAPDDPQILRKFLAEKGWSDQNMIDTALLRPGKNGGVPYAFFRDRVMFPVLDRLGQVVAFGGRILPEHIRPIDANSGFTPPKYMNSTETPLFHKGYMVYNESHARQNCAAGHPLIVVEGYADVIALAQYGFKGAVAPLGTALTENQIDVLWRLVPEEDMQAQFLASMDEAPESAEKKADNSVPYLCFDGDNAGQRAALRAVERILPMLRPGKSVRFVFMPKGLDPDDVLKQGGADAMDKLLKASISLLDMLWLMHTRGRDTATPESRASIEQKLMHSVSQIADRSVQGYYMSQMKERIWRELKSNKNTHSSYMARRGGGATQQNQQKVTLVSPSARAAQIREKILLAGLLNHPYLFDDYAEAIGVYPFQNAAHKGLQADLFEYIMGHDFASSDPEAMRAYSQDLQAFLQSKGHEHALSDILNESVFKMAGFIRAERDEQSVREGIDDVLSRHQA